jgi:predicted transcriptional regulator
VTVRDLHRSFRTPPYKTLMSALDTLYKKGLLRRKRASYLNAYTPTMSRQELETAVVGSIVDLGVE